MFERRTKIVATLGPATTSRETISRLIEAGMDVARVNSSHGSHEDHKLRIAAVRELAAAAGKPVAILQDLQGPKIRTGPLDGGNPIELRTGDRFTLTIERVPGDSQRVSTGYEALPRDVKPGDRILLSDGSIHLRAVETTDTEVITEVVSGGLLAEGQGINLPGVNISARGITEKDLEDLHFGLEQDVDYVAISFVRSAKEVTELKEKISEAGYKTPVIAKLEKPEAIDALDAIIDAADGVMVARGDLGVELAPEKVPLIQKRIIAAANRAAKPVITATQMLESMIHSPAPTRAEASDVANAILDGSDAVMLSGETAVGNYPVEAVETMVRIAQEIHLSAPAREPRFRRSDAFDRSQTRPEAIAAAVDAVVESLPGVNAIWVFTQSGSTARLIAHHRARVPIVAFTPSRHCYRQMSLIWGVTPIETDVVNNFRELEERIFPLAQHHGLAKPGDTVVITGSHPFNAEAPTNFLKVHSV